MSNQASTKLGQNSRILNSRNNTTRSNSTASTEDTRIPDATIIEFPSITLVYKLRADAITNARNPPCCLRQQAVV